MLVRSRHWTLVHAKRYLKRRRDADEAIAQGLGRRFRGLGHGCLQGAGPKELRTEALSWRGRPGLPCLGTLKYEWDAKVRTDAVLIGT